MIRLDKDLSLGAFHLEIFISEKVSYQLINFTNFYFQSRFVIYPSPIVLKIHVKSRPTYS